MKAFLGIFAGLLLVLTGCGGNGGSNNPVSPQAGGAVTVLMFSTPKCEACETLLPAIDTGINQTLANKKARITTKLFIVTSANGFGAPTAETAATYKAKLALSFDTLADFWKTGSYATYYGTDSLRVPGVVVVPEGNVPRIFANDEYIDPNAVLAYLQYLLR
jgi:hypothetical protein